MSGKRVRNSTIGEGIYERIKDYDTVSRKAFLDNLSEEHRQLYDKYRIAKTVPIIKTGMEIEKWRTTQREKK